MAAKSLKIKIKSVPLFLLFINRFKRIKWYFITGNNKDDYEYIKKMYRNATNRDLNLKNPERLTEKLQWLKLFYRDERIEQCSDKYLVRDYIAQKGHGDLLNECYGIYDNANKIDFDSLPEKFVMKATHGSGWNLVVNDKSKVNWFIWKRIFNCWLKQNLYVFGREWNYKNLKPRIIIEKYLEDDSGELRDYKVICFNGKPNFMQIDQNRASDHKRTYITVDGEIMDMNDGYPLIPDFTLEEIHNKIFKIAEDFADLSSYVRVDFYIANSKIYMGEITFFGASGFYTFSPDKCDVELGRQIVLPEPNNNLPLYNRINK